MQARGGSRTGTVALFSQVFGSWSAAVTVVAYRNQVERRVVGLALFPRPLLLICKA